MSIDYKRYPPNWKETRLRILDRAKNKCEFCGLKNKSFVYSVRYYIRHHDRYSYRHIWFRSKQDAIRECLNNEIKTVQVVLTIAHLDHDETNWNVKDNRLKATCQICHLRYDAYEKYRRSIEKALTPEQYSLFFAKHDNL